MSAVHHVDRMRDHWWWRPGWRAGRHFYACHISMVRHAPVVRVVEAYQASLHGISTLDLIPPDWLHLTMQGIGFVDEVTENEASKIAERLRDRLAAVTPLVVACHRPIVRPEAVYLPADPPEPLRALRAVVHEDIVGVLGEDRSEPLPQNPADYHPHVSIAYSNASQDAAPIAEALSKVHVEPVTIVLEYLDLLRFHRDHRMYEWTEAIPLRIGEGQRV
ncbi:2'-5' RNA ligase family protein [Micromonospora sp. KC606]|uniref:2'-5' RNA ligase family protein n=1 Tax=Micromonospora sp. KC606 TaxID=2530379 RepID=UPI00104F92A6|nr:2'-5' RNA ligase family protein [Micromonospora sp. KC606]TDC73540.1 2'-5' RNA ligase family protein [Micromonospora sp. KC606]